MQFITTMDDLAHNLNSHLLSICYLSIKLKKPSIRLHFDVTSVGSAWIFTRLGYVIAVVTATSKFVFINF